ncbi:hypothetical protein GCM10009546_40270 [Actinomadura livida]|uniref:Uncharacterized protein n=1 Tax=Actinomadura livida TaxID=79909 RepID=A0A7W7I9I8_9ACTN|nr:hypothetical protein [Actinomadura catellatispora]GGU17576.1 hypothetical protein GCM10010208_48170 [Actinomadura livida]
MSDATIPASGRGAFHAAGRRTPAGGGLRYDGGPADSATVPGNGRDVRKSVLTWEFLGQGGRRWRDPVVTNSCIDMSFDPVV